MPKAEVSNLEAQARGEKRELEMVQGFYPPNPPSPPHDASPPAELHFPNLPKLMGPMFRYQRLQATFVF